jgi:predicted nucleic acid-binding protein
MVKALVDTNILVDYLNGIADARTELGLYPDPAISVVTWMEVMVGATDATEASIRAFLGRFHVVDLDGAVAEEAVALRRFHKIKLPDAIIWASARETARLLVTRNTKDFATGDPGVRHPYSV